MSKLNTSERRFNTVFRRSTVPDPMVVSENARSLKLGQRWPAHDATDYINIKTISTRGSWPVVHLISEASLVRLGVASGALPKSALSMIDL